MSRNETPELIDMRAMITAARHEFDLRVEGVLTEARLSATQFAGAVGEVSADIAFDGWRRHLLERLHDR
jgi:hypothetical protein